VLRGVQKKGRRRRRKNKKKKKEGDKQMSFFSLPRTD
jgi:hypothetical protein